MNNQHFVNKAFRIFVINSILSSAEVFIGTFVDDDNFCITVGDVSGKGVPAALFMAMAKATVKDLVLRRLPVDEVITEANNTAAEFYGDDRLVTLIGAQKNRNIKSLCACVLDDVDKFSRGEPQFDDITMLGFKLEE